MTEAAIVEAVRAACMTGRTDQVEQVAKVADPSVVARFQAAMEVQEPTPIPFAQQVAATFDAAQGNHQGILHRIRALTELSHVKGPSAGILTELQYEVANLSFQQEVVTNIAKKASDAVSTLVKNG